MVKIIKDIIHGHIPIPLLCQKFMDTSEFQRLRRVRQLGMAHYVYPSATHTRFEHSLGVMYLAGKMVEQLRRYVFIDDRTKDLIQLAALYHDIGHFCYSHLFDLFLEYTLLSADVHQIFKLKEHEDRSIYFLKKVNLRLQLLTEEEEKFVANCIKGKIPENDKLCYLYQIVANKECGIDVDKLDYIQRDSVHLDLPGFKSNYIILNTMIDKDNHLAFHEKAGREIYDLFEMRKKLYHYVFHHHAINKLDKIYFCFMKRLGTSLYQYGDQTDDMNIETLIRNSSQCSDLTLALDNRELIHECEYCSQLTTSKVYKPSGTIDQVRFIYKSHV